jgi:hypothetical protein
MSKFLRRETQQVYTAGDYAGIDTEQLRFYYGYERTFCPEHGRQPDPEICECESCEWCFTVENGGGRELARYPFSVLLERVGGFRRDRWNCQENLMAGICLFLNEQTPDEHK